MSTSTSTTEFKKNQKVIWQGEHEGKVSRVRTTNVGVFVDVQFGDKKSGIKTKSCRPGHLAAL